VRSIVNAGSLSDLQHRAQGAACPHRVEAVVDPLQSKLDIGGAE
jgi:hypothetical protein